MTDHRVADNHEIYLKRTAIQIVAQLPEAQEDAMQVLRHAADLVRDFLHRDCESSTEKSGPNVVRPPTIP